MVRTRAAYAAEATMRASEQHDPQTPRRTRSAIPKGAHFKRAIVSPRIARQKNPNSDSEEDTGDEFNMYDEVTTPSKLFSGPLGPRVNHDTGAAKLFQDLPTEIHQKIALYLPEDSDIAHYSLICKSTAVTVTFSVWAKRFHQNFDSVADLTPGLLTWKYAHRRNACRRWVAFDLKGLGIRLTKNTIAVQEFNQENVMIVIKGLFLESNASMGLDDQGNTVVQGHNLSYLADLLTGRNGISYLDIVDSIFNTSFDQTGDETHGIKKIVTAAKEDTLIYVLQLCLTPLSLHHKYCNRKVNHFDISQFYAYSGARTQPVCSGPFLQHVNVRWVLHVVNFFKFHLKCDGEGLLAHEYKELGVNQIPQFWTGKIKAGIQPLGRHWKGVYTYLDSASLARLRVWEGQNSDIHPDALDGNEAFQDIDMFFDNPQNSSFAWREEWEDILLSNPFEDHRQILFAKTRRYPLGKPPGVRQFWGSCRGSKRGHFFGRVHPLTLQQGIHGFQRITFVKFYTQVDHDGEDVYDPLQTWAYEGVVLPGGRIIVGRWWAAGGNPQSNSTMAGPFMWWNIDSSDSETIEEQEALQFLESFQDIMEIV